MTRRIDLEGAYNFRDLGGYATPHAVTATGRLFHSDALSALTDRLVATLLDLGLTTVVDLRNARELETSPGVFAAHDRVRCQHNPVAVLGPTDLAPHERLLALDFAAHYIAGLERKYVVHRDAGSSTFALDRSVGRGRGRHFSSDLRHGWCLTDHGEHSGWSRFFSGAARS